MFVRCPVSPLRGLAATALLLLGGARAAAQDDPLPIETIDVYGSTALDSAAIGAQFEPDIQRYAAAMTAARQPGADLQAIEATVRGIEAKIAAELGARVPLAHVSVSGITNFAPPPPHLNVTIDVVEQVDAARRMPFRAAPTATLADPGGLLAAWTEYTQKVIALLFAGASLQIGAADCPALHCIAPFDRPELAPYRAVFDAGAREHEDALYAVAAESGLDSYRADALFVLAHTNDAARLLPVLGRAIYDPAEGVRNNAMRVLMFMAQANPDREYPIRNLIAALDFPATSDRNKAGWTLAALAHSPRYRDTIRAEAVPVALRLLRLEQPINHDPAYEILKAVSGEAFGDRDYAAWERWAAARG